MVFNLCVIPLVKGIYIVVCGIPLVLYGLPLYIPIWRSIKYDKYFLIKYLININILEYYIN